MIRKFNDFIIINESFNSPKLKRIIMDNGLPKNKYERNILHDSTDDDVVEVLDSVDDFNKKYGNKGGNQIDAKYFKKQYYYIELENGKILVLNNINTFKDVVEKETGQNIETLFDKIERKYKERHTGKRANIGDDIHRRHQSKVNKLKADRFIKELSKDKETVNDINNKINDAIKEYIYNEDNYDCYSHNSGSFETEVEYNEYSINIIGSWSADRTDKKHYSYVTIYDLNIRFDEIDKVLLYDEEGNEYDFTNLYEYPDDEIVNTIEDEDIHDYYGYNGVRREDFI